MRVLPLLGVLASVLPGCGRAQQPPAPTPVAPVMAAAAPSTPAMASPAPIASAAPPKEAAPAASTDGSVTKVECTASSGGQPVVLTVTWTDGGTGRGTLLAPAGGGTSVTRNVVVQLYKGLVLVDVAGTRNITGKLATVDETEDPKRKIQLGDWKQPWLDCK